MTQAELEALRLLLEELRLADKSVSEEQAFRLVGAIESLIREALFRHLAWEHGGQE